MPHEKRSLALWLCTSTDRPLSMVPEIERAFEDYSFEECLEAANVMICEEDVLESKTQIETQFRPKESPKRWRQHPSTLGFPRAIYR